jgi:hypothetical protein
MILDRQGGTEMLGNTYSVETLNKAYRKSIEKTYNSNLSTDYTEKIEALGKSFNYSSNSDRYWSEPELSIFYGTPLYEQASISQKLALNHLYWAWQYSHAANTEASTVFYNQVTAGVFAKVEGYETLCQNLLHETQQEIFHMNAFHKIGYQTKLALLGKAGLGNPLYKQSNNKPKFNLGLASNLLENDRVSNFCQNSQENSFRFVTNLMLGNGRAYYSDYLKNLETGSIPTSRGGLGGLVFPSAALSKFLTINWGSSPFLASQYYTLRMLGNMSLKIYEHRYFKYFKDLQKQKEIVPEPTAVSYYHLLDEAFHTTISQTIAREVSQDFEATANCYEKYLANLTVYLTQKSILSGLAGGLIAVFRQEIDLLLLSYYKLLKSPVFNMPTEEALQWMEKCLCQEHEGFHANLKYHQRLHLDLCNLCDRLNYLWPVNREMRLMAAGGSIDRAIQTNTKALKQFASAIAY